METRSPGRNAVTNDFAAPLIRLTSARVEPEVSSNNATSNGASVVAKLEIFWGALSSYNTKLSARRLGKGLPFESVTTAGTETSLVSTRTTSSLTSWLVSGLPLGDFLSGV